MKTQLSGIETQLKLCSHLRGGSAGILLKKNIVFVTLDGGDKEDTIQGLPLGWRNHGRGDLLRGEIGLGSKDSVDLYLIQGKLIAKERVATVGLRGRKSLRGALGVDGDSGSSDQAGSVPTAGCSDQASPGQEEDLIRRMGDSG